MTVTDRRPDREDQRRRVARQVRLARELLTDAGGLLLTDEAEKWVDIWGACDDDRTAEVRDRGRPPRR